MAFHKWWTMPLIFFPSEKPSDVGGGVASADSVSAAASCGELTETKGPTLELRCLFKPPSPPKSFTSGVTYIEHRNNVTVLTLAHWTAMNLFVFSFNCQL